VKARVAALAALLGLTTFGFAGGVGALQGCTPAHLDAPSQELAVLEMAVPDIALEPLLDAPFGEGLDTHACTGKIRPGVRMTAPVGCTMSWIFRDALDNLYQTVAGHCTGSLGQSVSVNGVPGRIGEVVYRINAGVGRDIALVKVDPDKEGFVDPTLCHWGGPTGIATPAGASVAGQDAMLHYGWGVAFSGQTTRARAGVLPSTGWYADGSVRMYGLTDGGDSGSPMMLSNGLAAGVHTHRVGANTYLTQKAATRLDVWVPNIEAALGLGLEIVPGHPVDLTGLSIEG
jgi:hypothetical protein